MINLEIINNNILLCKNCILHKDRIQPVYGHGNNNASIVIVGEGPGRNEDEQGIPFVGTAGSVLNEALQSIKLDRKDVYITNVVKCRPPQNRKPTKEESEECGNYLLHEILQIKPKIIIALGLTAANYLLNTDLPMKSMYGNTYSIEIDTVKFNVLVNYHPASLLYNKNLKEVFFDIFKQNEKLIVN